MSQEKVAYVVQAPTSLVESDDDQNDVPNEINDDWDKQFFFIDDKFDPNDSDAAECELILF